MASGLLRRASGKRTTTSTRIWPSMISVAALPPTAVQ